MKIYDKVKYMGQNYYILAIIADCNERKTFTYTLGVKFGYGYKPLYCGVKSEEVESQEKGSK